MIRPVEDFMRAAVEHGISAWPIHSCSGCRYPCGFLIHGEGVLYDSGCDCTGANDVRSSSWAELAEHYNRNQPENNPNIKQAWLDEVAVFWGFAAVDA